MYISLEKLIKKQESKVVLKFLINFLIIESRKLAKVLLRTAGVRFQK